MDTINPAKVEEITPTAKPSTNASVDAKKDYASPSFEMSSTVKILLGTLAIVAVVILVAVLVIRHEKMKYTNKCQELTVMENDILEHQQKIQEQNSISNSLNRNVENYKQMINDLNKRPPTITNAAIPIPKMNSGDSFQLSDEMQTRAKPLSSKQLQQQLVNKKRTTNEDLMKVDNEAIERSEKDAEEQISKLVNNKKVEEVLDDEDVEDIVEVDADDEALPIVGSVIPNQ